MSTSRGRLDEAADYFRKSLEIDPNFAPAHNNLGLALKGQGNWSEAYHQFHVAIRFGPELAPPHNNLGELRAYKGWLDEAIAEYRQALRLDPEFGRAEYMLGVALAAQGRLDEANDRDQRALRDDPVRAEAQKKTRLIAVDQGIINYQRALGIDPNAHALPRQPWPRPGRRGPAERGGWPLRDGRPDRTVALVGARGTGPGARGPGAVPRGLDRDPPLP